MRWASNALVISNRSYTDLILLASPITSHLVPPPPGEEKQLPDQVKEHSAKMPRAGGGGQHGLEVPIVHKIEIYLGRTPEGLDFHSSLHHTSLEACLPTLSLIPAL